MNEQKPITCPVCGKLLCVQYEVEERDKKKVNWFHCFCGTVFHNLGIDKKAFDGEYLKTWKDMKDVAERMRYVIKTYISMIEEMTYGRKFLDVGFTIPHRIDDMKRRGWIATGIDLIPGNGHIVGDFEELEFEDTFDFIVMGHCLESFNDPQKALEKAYNMLNPGGLLLITTPAPEMIFSHGISNFGHWSSKYNRIFISKHQLIKMAHKGGFEVVFARWNYNQRYECWNDLHILLQK